MTATDEREALAAFKEWWNAEPHGTAATRRPTMPDIPEFAPGDRVRVKPETADNWVDPKLASRVRKMRSATVRRVIGTEIAPSQRSYLIEFDVAGRELPFSDMIGARYLERVDNA